MTCRDWFQLTLKEGLTVYRDSSFSADMTSEAVKRIEDVHPMHVCTRASSHVYGTCVACMHRSSASRTCA